MKMLPFYGQPSTLNEKCLQDVLLFTDVNCSEIGLFDTGLLSSVHLLKDVPKNAAKMKSRFSHCDQIKFNEPVLKPGLYQ